MHLNRAAHLMASVLLCTMAIFQSAMAKEYRGTCPGIYKNHYLTGKSHKAFAMTVPLSRLHDKIGIFCGGQDSVRSKELAMHYALDRCKKELSVAGLKGNCRIVGAE